MQRDMDLVREILMALEKSEEFSPSEDELFGALRVKDDLQGMRSVLWHLKIMEQAGLVTQAWEEYDNWEAEGPTFRGAQITWQGYEFLAAAMNETVWNKAKEQAGGLFKSMAIPTLNALLQTVIKSQLNLP